MSDTTPWLKAYCDDCGRQVILKYLENGLCFRCRRLLSGDPPAFPPGDVLSHNDVWRHWVDYGGEG